MARRFFRGGLLFPLFIGVAGCAPQVPTEPALPTWRPPNDRAISGGTVTNLAEDISSDSGPVTAATTAQWLSTLNVLARDPNADGENTQPQSVASDGQALELAEAVHQAVHGVVNVVTGMDPLRHLLGTSVDFQLMPTSGLHSECPAVAYVATEDSLAWALAVDYEFRPSAAGAGAVEPCLSDVDAGQTVQGVLGLVHPRGGVAALVSERLRIGGRAFEVSGGGAVSGDGDGLALVGDIRVAREGDDVEGQINIALQESGVWDVVAATLSVNAEPNVMDLTVSGLRSAPLQTHNFVPLAGTLTFTLPTDNTVLVEFRASTPVDGVVWVTVGQGAPTPMAIPGLIP